MLVKDVYRGATYKSVRVTDLDTNTTERDIVLVAFACAGETRSSTFGHTVNYARDGELIPLGDDNSQANEATVIIHTD